VLDQKRLLKAIDDDLMTCREAGRLNSTNGSAKERNILEFNTLKAHLQWAKSVDTDQTDLERIVHSLEANPFLSGYPRWRERCQS
jgi:hypothetical protein